MATVTVVEEYACPWCPTRVINVAGGSAMSVFEKHLDEEHAAQIARALRPVPPRPRRRQDRKAIR